MSDYFFLFSKVKKGTAVANTEGETPLSHDLMPAMRGLTEVPFELKLKNVAYVNRKLVVSDDLSGIQHLWPDLQPNNLAWILLSEKAKDLIEPRLTLKEGIVWMQVWVKSDIQIRKYFIPRFERKLDVLDQEKTLFSPGSEFALKPVFSLAKIADYNVFSAPSQFYEIPSSLYVSEEIKKILVKEKITGVDFRKAEVV